MLNTETSGGGKKTFFRRVRCVKMSEAVFIFVLKTFLGAPPLGLLYYGLHQLNLKFSGSRVIFLEGGGLKIYFKFKFSGSTYGG